MPKRTKWTVEKTIQCFHWKYWQLPGERSWKGQVAILLMYDYIDLKNEFRCNFVYFHLFLGHLPCCVNAHGQADQLPKSSPSAKLLLLRQRKCTQVHAIGRIIDRRWMWLQMGSGTFGCYVMNILSISAHHGRSCMTDGVVVPSAQAGDCLLQFCHCQI